MPQHADILDDRESLRNPFVASIGLHAGVFALIVGAAAYSAHTRESWGTPNPSGGSIAVNAVKSIPLPSRQGRVNPVANDTESQVPAPPKVQPKPQVRPPEPNAIPLRMRDQPKKPQYTPPSPTHYQAQPYRPNQVYSTQGAAAVSPMYQKAGSPGAVGVGENSVFGTRYSAYAQLIIQRVAERWQTAGLAGVTAPVVIVTFDIQRDGSVRNPQLEQRSGNSTLDYSALRAISEAAPFPPLPPDFNRDSANVELRFQLRQ